MPDAKQGFPAPFADMLNPTAMVPMVTKSVDMWLNWQKEMLSGIETAIAEWAKGQREAAEVARQAFERISACREPMQLLEIQRELMSETMQRTATNAGALGESVVALAKKRTVEIEAASRQLMESARGAGAEMLKAAGSKPARPQAAKKTGAA
jgi:hypothetical protein